MISSERGEAEKQRTPMSSPTPSKHFPIYLYLLTSGDSHGFYYAIEEKGESPAPQYRRPRVKTSVAEEDVEYPLPILNLNHDKEVEDEDDENNDDDPVMEANDEARAEAFYGGVPTYKPSARPSASGSGSGSCSCSGSGSDSGSGSGSDSGSDVAYASASASDSEEESPPKKSKLEPMEDQSGQITTDNYSKKTKEGEILVIYPSETDTIRPLQFPDLPFVPLESDLLLVGESFYFIGGYNVPKSGDGFMDDFPAMTNMYFWDTDVDKVWKLLPGPTLVSSIDHHPPHKAAVWAAGTLVVMGISFKEEWRYTFRGLSSGDTAWKTLPRFPAMYISRISIVHPLAVNGSKIFFQVNGRVFLSKCRNRLVHMAAYFDVKLWQWEIVGTWFPGVWSPGVLLYDAYLFSYGSMKGFMKKYHICVYSIERKCWLRRPVRGLKRDGNVLPDDLSEEFSRVAAYLFQVKDNVLAFVWSRSPVLRLKEEKELSDVHCTKFILHCIKDPRKKHPVFRAEVISYGNWLVEGQQLQNCLLKQSVRT